MNNKPDNRDWPSVAGDPNSLPTEMTPPDGLEDRVVRSLVSRNLITQNQPTINRGFGWQALRATLVAAAGIALLAVGVVIGQSGSVPIPGSLTALTGAETDLYALLLFETPEYDSPDAQEAIGRYGEYSQWIAQARAQEQFVTGEDLEAENGWLLAPRDGEVVVSEAVALAGSAPLSGVLFIRAATVAEALELAKELPHIRHGGSVVVQKTLRTDIPPGAPGAQ